MFLHTIHVAIVLFYGLTYSSMHKFLWLTFNNVVRVYFVQCETKFFHVVTLMGCYQAWNAALHFGPGAQSATGSQATTPSNYSGARLIRTTNARKHRANYPSPFYVK